MRLAFMAATAAGVPHVAATAVIWRTRSATPRETRSVDDHTIDSAPTRLWLEANLAAGAFAADGLSPGLVSSQRERVEHVNCADRLAGNELHGRHLGEFVAGQFVRSSSRRGPCTARQSVAR